MNKVNSFNFDTQRHLLSAGTLRKREDVLAFLSQNPLNLANLLVSDRVIRHVNEIKHCLIRDNTRHIYVGTYDIPLFCWYMAMADAAVNDPELYRSVAVNAAAEIAEFVGLSGQDRQTFLLKMSKEHMFLTVMAMELIKYYVQKMVTGAIIIRDQVNGFRPNAEDEETISAVSKEIEHGCRLVGFGDQSNSILVDDMETITVWLTSTSTGEGHNRVAINKLATNIKNVLSSLKECCSIANLYVDKGGMEVIRSMYRSAEHAPEKQITKLMKILNAAESI